jgi:hypothetical protein
MNRATLWLITLPCVLICMLPVRLLEGATVQGKLSYAGLPVKATFTNHTNTAVYAWDYAKDKYYSGTASLDSGTYSIPAVPAGDVSVVIRLSTRATADGLLRPDDLGATAYLKVAGESSIALDLELRYANHLTQPFDSTSIWNGSATSCPYGPELPTTFTLAWNPVPRASSYSLRVLRKTCSAAIKGDIQTTTSTSVQVQQLQVANEAYIKVEVTAIDSRGQDLSVDPYIYYGTSTQSSGVFFHASRAPGRPKRFAGAYFILGVAHSQGTPPTFWRSDLILRNPTSAQISSVLTFTPRDKDGMVTYQSVTVNVTARSCRVISDAVDALFHTSGAGTLEVFPATLDAAVRTYTPGGGAGLYGQSYEPISSSQMALDTDPPQVIGRGGVTKGTQRTNLTIAEVWGESAEVLIVLRDRDGKEVGRKTVSLGPFGNTQINDLVGKLGGPASFAEGQVTLEVTSGSGRVGGCLSIVDNQSQDPTTLPLIHL